MPRLEVSGAVRPLYGSLGVKGLKHQTMHKAQRQTIANRRSAHPARYDLTL